jgi:hypothetical protein
MLDEFPIHLAAIRAERDALESAFRTRIDGALVDGSDADRTQAVAECWADADATRASLVRRVRDRPRPVLAAGVSLEEAAE